MEMTNLSISMENQKRSLQQDIDDLREAVKSGNRRKVLKFEKFIDMLEDDERETALCLLDCNDY